MVWYLSISGAEGPESAVVQNILACSTHRKQIFFYTWRVLLQYLFLSYFLAPLGAQEVALSMCPSVCVSLLWILHSTLRNVMSNTQTSSWGTLRLCLGLPEPSYLKKSVKKYKMSTSKTLFCFIISLDNNAKPTFLLTLLKTFFISGTWSLKLYLTSYVL